MVASTDTQIAVKGFVGLNLEQNARSIEDGQLSECVNFNLERGGELTKRQGLIKVNSGAVLGSNAVTILGHYLTSTHSQIIVKAGDNVFYSNDGITFTLIGAYPTATYGVQYNSKFYIIRSSAEMVEWDGAAASVVTGSPSGTFGIIHKERMFVLNSVAAGSLNSRYYFSSPGNVTSTGWPSTNFIDVQPGDGDFLVAMAIIQDLLIIFKGKTTWALYTQGTTTDWVQRNLSYEVGCISKYSIQLAQDYIYFSGESAIYRTDGASFEKISEAIGSLIEDRIVNLTTVNQDSFAYWENKLICLIAPDASTKRYFVYHFKSNGWTEWEFAGGIAPGTFLEIRTNTPQQGLYAGDLSSSGNLLRLGDGVFADIGVNYPCRFRTKQFAFDSPNNMKRGKWVGVEMMGLVTFNYAHEVDGEVTSSGAAISESSTRQVKIPGPGYFRTWLFDFDMTSGTEFIFFGLVLQVSAKRTVIGART